MVEASGASRIIDRSSSSAVGNLISFGPYKAVFAAADAASDQSIIGTVLAAQGGGSFLSTMGVRDGVQLPDGVTGHFIQYIDDYVKTENREFTDWVFRDVIENGFRSGEVREINHLVIGGLDKVQQGLDMLRTGAAGGAKLIVNPDNDCPRRGG